MTNVSRVAGLGGNYQKKKKCRRNSTLPTKTYKHKETTKKMVGVWYLFTYFFTSISMFKSQLKISNCMRGLLTQVQLIDLRSSIKLLIFEQLKRTLNSLLLTPLIYCWSYQFALLIQIYFWKSVTSNW